MKKEFYTYDISIVIVSYNELDILDNCIKSLIQHSNGFSYEIIVVDNATTSGDVKIVTDNYPQVKLIQNETNQGFASANNQGFEIAKGKYILILNNDTVFYENTIRKIKDFVESNHEEMMVGCRLLNADGSFQISVVDFDNPWNSFTENFFLYKFFPSSKLFNKFYQNYHDYTTPIEVDVVKGAFILCLAESIYKLKGFDNRFFFYSEEADLCYRFKKNGGKVYFYPLTSVYHLGGATTAKNLWFKFKNQGVAKIQFYQKHFKSFKFFLCIFFHYTGLLMRSPLYFIFGLITFNKFQFLKSFYYLKQLFYYPPNKFK